MGITTSIIRFASSLEIATEEHDLESIRDLLVDHRDRDDVEDCYLYAVLDGSIDVVTEFLNSCPNLKDIYDSFALCHSVRYSPKLARRLVKLNANVFARNNYPLRECIKRENMDLLKLMLDYNKNYQEILPQLLSVALKHKRQAICRLIMEKAFAPSKILTIEHIRLAIKSRHNEMLNYLLNFNSSLVEEIKEQDLLNVYNNHELFVILQKHGFELSYKEVLLRKLLKFKLFRTIGLFFDEEDLDYRLILIHAVKSNNISYVDAILHDFDQPETDSIALMEASRLGHIELVRLILERIKDYPSVIHVRDDYAFRRAAKGGHLEVVKLLVKAGADVRAYNYYAHRWAVRNKRVDIIDYLLGYYEKRLERYE